MAIDYSQGTYFGGAGLDAISAEGQVAQSGGGSGLLTTIGSFAGGPGGAAVGGLLGLVGKGISGWLNRKKEAEAKKEGQRRYDEQMSFRREQFEVETEMARKRNKLTKAQMLSNIRQQNVENENFLNERNNQRANDMYSKLMGQINQPDFKNKLQAIYGT